MVDALYDLRHWFGYSSKDSRGNFSEMMTNGGELKSFVRGLN